MNDQELLAKKIVNIRESQNMSQLELAQKANIERTALNKIEKGTRKVSSDELKRIALALHQSTDSLLNIVTNSGSMTNDGAALTWSDLNMPMPYGGKLPEELKDTYVDLAKSYFKRHPEMLNKDE